MVGADILETQFIADCEGGQALLDQLAGAGFAQAAEGPALEPVWSRDAGYLFGIALKLLPDVNVGSGRGT